MTIYYDGKLAFSARVLVSLFCFVSVYKIFSSIVFIYLTQLKTYSVQIISKVHTL